MVWCGLASKAGKIACGADCVEEAIIKKKVFTIIIAEDGSLKTKEKFQKIAKENNIPIFVFGTIDDNSRAIGKKNKAIIAIKDKNFSEAICKIINGGEAIGQN